MQPHTSAQQPDKTTHTGGATSAAVPVHDGAHNDTHSGGAHGGDAAQAAMETQEEGFGSPLGGVHPVEAAPGGGEATGVPMEDDDHVVYYQPHEAHGEEDMVGMAHAHAPISMTLQTHATHLQHEGIGDDDSTIDLYQQIIRRRSSPKPQRVPLGGTAAVGVAPPRLPSPATPRQAVVLLDVCCW